MVVCCALFVDRCRVFFVVAFVVCGWMLVVVCCCLRLFAVVFCSLFVIVVRCLLVVCLLFVRRWLFVDVVFCLFLWVCNFLLLAFFCS